MAAAEGWTPRQDNPYAGPGDEGLDDAAPVDARAAATDPDATRMAPAAAVPDAGGDPDATRLAAAPDTVRVPDPGATRVADPDATVLSAAQATSDVDPGATRLAAAPDTVRVADPGATRVYDRPAGDAPAVDPTVYSRAAALERSVAAGGRTEARPTGRRAATPRTAPADLQRARAARDLLDRRGAAWDDAAWEGEPRGRRRRAASRGSLGRRRLRFWRWFRTIPILLMVLMGTLSVALGLLPGATVRHWLYPVHYAQAVQDSAERHGVDPSLVAAVIKSESNWVSTARSGVGAEGLMQLMPSTARELANRGIVDGSVYDPDDLSDPATNIEYGTAYLATLLDSTGSTDKAVAAYNAGPGAASSWDGGGSDFKDAIEFPETRLYLEKVTEAYEQYRALYPDGLVDDAVTR